MPVAGAQIQSHLGRYELLARLATGGMGEIFLARLEGAAGFEKLYVVKRILPHLADDTRFRQMLIAEASIASKMSHPNICQVYELGETEGQLYIVMEYLEGVPMLSLLRRVSKEQQHLDYGFVAGVIQQTCDALHYAHELKDRSGEYLGIIHRDVTPSNVFVTESGVAKVLDFGIAKAKGASTQTQEGTVKGKYAYMAPEQLRGAAIDRRVDVFALGVVLYEMLALRRLFQRKTDYLTFRAVMEQPIPDIRRYRSDVPPALADAIARALEREPGTRFETARQFGSALLDAMAPLGRPWTQGELGDFVRANFADQLDKRSQQVASVVHRTAPGAQGHRATMPLIAQPEGDPGADTDEDDDMFPSVETEPVPGGGAFIPFTPVGSTPGTPSARPVSNDFTGGTPPPFSTDSNPSGPSLQFLTKPVIPPGPQSGTVVVMPRRSLVWPLFAVAMVAVAGGALFLVWQQMQHQRDQLAPQIIVTEQKTAGVVAATGSNSASGAPPDASAVDDAVAAGSGSAGIARVDGKRPTSRPIKPAALHSGPYDRAINAKKPAMVQCLRDHAVGAGPAKATAVIVIAASGQPKSVKLEPASLDATPLGACIRKVLSTAGFPRAPKDVQISVPFRAKTKTS